MRTNVRRPVVFVGSSSPALSTAKAVGEGLRDIAELVVWDSAFDTETWLLGGILQMTRQCDFGVFIVRADDTAVIKGTKYRTVRDNVLFELGVFMGALGPKRSILLWPNGRASEDLRLPSDLAGLLVVRYSSASTTRGRDTFPAAIRTIRARVEKEGPAPRNWFDELAALRQALHEREIDFHGDESESLLEIVSRGARRRARPWFTATPVSKLTNEMQIHYERDVVDEVFWWLVLFGVVTFDNIEVWNTGDDWSFESSLDFAVFTTRGLALLNELGSHTVRTR